MADLDRLSSAAIRSMPVITSKHRDQVPSWAAHYERSRAAMARLRGEEAAERLLGRMRP